MALIRSCHPVPSVAVTAFATLLAIAAGNSAGTTVLLAAAIFAGQLTVGWSNDRIDVERDRRVGHPGKPLAAGEVPLRLVDTALAAAVVVAVGLSLALGWRPGLLHLGAVAGAWVFNAWLKRTLVSWLPYTVAFAALPAIATLALPAHPWPLWWVMVAGAVLGTAVNFLNALPDLANRPRSDVHALPDRLGGRLSLVIGDILLAGAAAIIVWAPAGGATAGALAGAAIAWLLIALELPLMWPRADTRLPFYGMLVIAPVEALTLALTAHPLH